MKRELLDALLRERAAGRPVALATDLASGEQWLLRLDDATAPAELAPEVLDATRAVLRADRAAVEELGRRSLLVAPFNPPLRLVAVGAVHIAQALAPMAALAGFAVTVVDPRTAFATAERFPGVALSSAWPDAALAKLRPDARTAIVTLAHDPKLDDPALLAALASDAFYVGALGSRKTHAKRLARLREAGVSEDALARIHAPVGLAIGARSPAEIAVSILAEAIQRLRVSA